WAGDRMGGRDQVDADAVAVAQVGIGEGDAAGRGQVGGAVVGMVGQLGPPAVARDRVLERDLELVARAGRNGIVGVGAAGISPDRNVVRARLGEGIAKVGVDAAGAAGAAVAGARVGVEGDAVAVRSPQVQVGVERYGRIGAVVDVERGPGSRF